MTQCPGNAMELRKNTWNFVKMSCNILEIDFESIVVTMIWRAMFCFIFTSEKQ